MSTRSQTLLILTGLLGLGACRTTPPSLRDTGSQESSSPDDKDDDPADSGDVVDSDAAPRDGRALVLISLDGFRWDYLDRVDTPNLDRIAAGVRAESLVPPFPSYTFPSHYTLVTGLHPEHHGIVSNVFYDPERREQFKLGAPEDMTDGRWWGGEPVWNTAERQGMPAATLFWPGSEADIGGMRPSEYTAYDSGMPHTERVDRVLSWLRRDPATRPGLLTLYFSSVDSAGHGHGPDDPAVDQAVRGVDQAVGRLLDGIEASSLSDKVDLVVVSDHGMAPKDPEKIVFLDQADVDLQGVHIVEYSPLLQARITDAERAESVRAAIDALDHVQCHLQDQTPPDWHYRDHRAIGDVVCLAENGWQLTQRDYYQSNPDRFTGGTHGWDPDWKAMHGIFLADGPRIRDGQRLGTVSAVDVYGVLCAIAGLEPAPNDGDPGLIDQVVEAQE